MPGTSTGSYQSGTQYLNNWDILMSLLHNRRRRLTGVVGGLPQDREEEYKTQAYRDLYRTYVTQLMRQARDAGASNAQLDELNASLGQTGQVPQHGYGYKKLPAKKKQGGRKPPAKKGNRKSPAKKTAAKKAAAKKGSRKSPAKKVMKKRGKK